MKSVKNHIMFIFPLMAILLGVEFFTVFERMTGEYEQRLKEGYSMLVVSKRPLDMKRLQSIDARIAALKSVSREAVVEQVGDDLKAEDRQAILKLLPYFYDVSLGSYVDTAELDRIKANLEKQKDIVRVETFGNSYASAYKLFYFIKFLLKIFIGFITVVSSLLVVKQMEIWKYEHRERMQIMEIFGAPLMLRAGVLFRIAIIDAFLATILTSAVFVYAKYVWAQHSGIELIRQKKEALFRFDDLSVLFLLALSIVLIAVYLVVISNRKGTDS